MKRARRAVAGCGSVRCSVRVPATVTHSPINFGSRSIDHNVLFCSLVFLSAAFDSIRGCGESIYLPRCHAPPVMDGCCTLTLTPKGEAVPRTYPHQARLRFRSWSLLCLSLFSSFSAFFHPRLTVSLYSVLSYLSASVC